MRVRIDGGGAVKLNPEFAFPDADVESFQISPDGNNVVYLADQDLDEVLELYSVPSGGGIAAKLNPSLAAGRTVSEFLISPDGSRVVYLANQDANNRIELYSVPIAGGVAVKLNHPFLVHRMTLIRSMHHDAPSHRSAAYWNLTGHAPQKPDKNWERTRKNWPSIGSMVAHARHDQGIL